MLLALAAAPAAAQNSPEHLKSLSKEGIDNSVSPRQDFYRHVNDTWMKDHPLTPEYSR